MILIFSQENDISTNDIIDWLMYFQHEFVRINIDEKTPINNQLLLTNRKEEHILKYKGRAIDLNKISSF